MSGDDSDAQQTTTSEERCRRSGGRNVSAYVIIFSFGTLPRTKSDLTPSTSTPPLDISTNPAPVSNQAIRKPCNRATRLQSPLVYSFKLTIGLQLGSIHARIVPQLSVPSTYMYNLSSQSSILAFEFSDKFFVLFPSRLAPGV